MTSDRIATEDYATAAVAALSSTYQPLDSDLTAIAALSTTSYGRAFLALADAAAARTALALGTAATSATGAFDASGAAAAAQAASQPLDSDLTAIAALTTTSFGRALLALADAAALRTAAGLGTAATQATSAFDAAGAATAAQAAAIAASQPVDSDLTAIAALTTTSFGRGLLALADAAALRTSAGLGTAATANTGTGSTNVPLGGVITGAGPTGDASHTLTLTYNAAGQLTAVTNNAIVIAESAVTNLTTDLAAKASSTLAVGGDLTGNLPNPTLATAGPGATGPIGSATAVPVVTIDAKGRVTALTSATISAGPSLGLVNALSLHNFAP